MEFEEDTLVPSPKATRTFLVDTGTETEQNSGKEISEKTTNSNLSI